MTSLSPRKLPITRPNTPPSRFANRPFPARLAPAALLLAGLASLACAAPDAEVPGCCPENAAPPAARRAPRGGHQPSQARLRFLELARESRAAQRGVANAAATPAARAPAIKAVEFNPAAVPEAPAEPAAPVPAQPEPEYLPAEPMPPVSRVARPFKPMREIRPHFDYDSEAVSGRRDLCRNLCPRPAPPDCPECPAGDALDESGRLFCDECPEEFLLHQEAPDVSRVAGFRQRNFPEICYCWEASNTFHYPIYFEDFSLERYGHTRHFLIQPFFSASYAALQFVGLPYQMTIDPIRKKRYTLGWYRPGTYVPHRYHQIPWNTEAALVEAGVLTGAYFLFAPSVSP